MANKEGNSSSGMSHNRKRRLRASQDVFGSTTSIDSSTSLDANNSNTAARKKSDLSCVVCCGAAHGYNFDAISCESCKAFFRRNALLNSDRLKCRRDGACEITLETRRRCKSCRLKKCFAVGMRKEWILTEEEKLNKKRRIEENRKLRLATMNEPVLTKEANDEPMDDPENCGLDFQNVVLEREQTPSLKPTKFVRNIDFIDYVARAFNDGFQLDPISYGWSYPLAKKITALYQILHTKNTTALRLISFYKRLSEFDALNDLDKLNLIKYNLPYIFFFHGSLGYDPINDIYHEGIPSNDMLLYGADIREVHGEDIHSRCALIMRSLSSCVQMDRRIMQLALVIFLFSKGLSGIQSLQEPTLNNHQQVFHTQNIYIEQLWIFLEQNFGSSRTVLTFSTLVSRCLLVQKLFRDIQNDVNQRVDPYQVPPIIRTIMHLA